MIEFIELNSSHGHYIYVCKLLSQLTTLGTNTYEEYIGYILNSNKSKFTYLMKVNDNIVGIGTILIEKKIIHSFKSVGHIEDIVIDKEHIGKKYGKYLIKYLLDKARLNNCYKAILDCNVDIQGFYEYCGFKNKGMCMGYYFE